MRFLILSVSLSISSLASAELIKFPEEQLPGEAVLPVFQETKAVMNRNIVLQQKIEIGLFGSAALNEPFIEPFGFGLVAGYHLSETSAVQFQYVNLMGGESTYQKQLQQAGLVNFSGAPFLKSMILANYEYTAWYGKISLAKQWVHQLHMFYLLGGGAVNVGGQLNPAVSLGIGQKYYLTPSLALRIDLKGLVYNGADPLSLTVPAGQTSPDTSQFEKRIYFNLLATVGFAYLI